jgi:hypothetical protein
MFVAFAGLLLPQCDAFGEKGDAQDIEVPLNLSTDPNDADQGWVRIQFSNVSPSVVTTDSNTLTVEVRDSVTPLVYFFPDEVRVQTVNFQGRTTGLPTLPRGGEQGQRGTDDFVLRLGLVVPGKRKLGPFERRFAPVWLKRLFSLAPDGTGLDHVSMLSVANAPPPAWKERVHPGFKGFFRERIVASLTQPGAFHVEAKLEEPLDVVALWMCSDGDDTDSAFDITITRIRLVRPEQGDPDTRRHDDS